MANRVYSDADFANPSADCDIIMKGGITSGVVYPLTIAELAKRYRFVSIGGTSAGAIAAGAAAAAEYGRHVPGKGFMRLVRLPEETGEILFSLFQPTAKVAPLFDVLVAGLRHAGGWRRVAAIAWALIWGFRTGALAGALSAAGAAWLLDRYAGIGGVAFGVLLTALALAAGVLAAAWRALTRHLPANHYGLCTGKQQPGFSGPAFTEWLADLIDDAAGRDVRGDPLTFGALRKRPNGPSIDLRMMTTNLSMGRPYSLPLRDAGYFFRRADFAALFPDRVMAYLLRVCRRVRVDGQDYHAFPRLDQLPVIVAARMSLSFPILISAVPLYRRDRTLKAAHQKKLQLCLFSDGGLSSNFPIHFFDNLLPRRPTFGVSLDEYDVRRDRRIAAEEEAAHARPGADVSREQRVHLPRSARSGIHLPIQPFDGLFAFLARLINTAKDWQDSMQGTLSGYRERIVHVNLKRHEGGLNIVMPKALVETLGDLGAEAGKALRRDFSFDEHRWRRFLVALERLDKTLESVLTAYKGGSGSESFEEFLARYACKPGNYRQDPHHVSLLRARVASLAGLAEAWAAQPDIPERRFPQPAPDLRITPRQ